jgi:hypothetical protein
MMTGKDECDFCSSPDVVRRYQCMDFDSESKDAGVLYDGVNLDLHSTNYWAACAECAKLVDAEDIDALLERAVKALEVKTRLRPRRYVAFKSHVRHSYELFFKHRIRIAQ